MASPQRCSVGVVLGPASLSPHTHSPEGHSRGQHGQPQEHGQWGSGRGVHPGLLQAACMVSPPWELGNLVWQEEQGYL